MYVVAGSKQRLKSTKATQKIYVKSSIVHPMYSSTGHIADIGILRMMKNFVFDGTTVAPIPLAKVTPYPYTQCTTGGWGSVYYHGPSPDLILFADLQILSQSACRSLIPHYEFGMICAKNFKAPEMDACQGDSGGPLICGYRLCGVVSFGYDCGDSFPSVYTDIAHYREWIIENSATMLNYYLCKLEFIPLLLGILVQNFYD
ncbi:trypsin epsilon-like [Teleopsis dalmanni]|uniref:trypsin epsilon-like n=1 Tax=Teleopsis dalmanni TaxID=139649 RepID=UPI0018CCEC96|nr:trypsin epsilon-like [Teleopsis dalmanni]